MRIVCFSDCPRHLHSLLHPHLLPDHPVLPSARQLHLPGCGGQIPCATPLRTLAPWPRTSHPRLELLKFRKVSGAGSGLVLHEVAEKAVAREAARHDRVSRRCR